MTFIKLRISEIRNLKISESQNFKNKKLRKIFLSFYFLKF